MADYLSQTALSMGEDAALLHAQQAHFNSCYLGGYVVECYMKLLLQLHNTNYKVHHLAQLEELLKQQPLFQGSQLYYLPLDETCPTIKQSEAHSWHPVYRYNDGQRWGDEKVASAYEAELQAVIAMIKRMQLDGNVPEEVPAMGGDKKAQSIEVTDYFRHAARRMYESSTILHREQRWKNSCYLAGYTVECYLKWQLEQYGIEIKQHALKRLLKELALQDGSFIDVRQLCPTIVSGYNRWDPRYRYSGDHWNEAVSSQYGHECQQLYAVMVSDLIDGR